MIRGFFFTFFERNEEISDIIECDKMFEWFTYFSDDYSNFERFLKLQKIYFKSSTKISKKNMRKTLLLHSWEIVRNFYHKKMEMFFVFQAVCRSHSFWRNPSHKNGMNAFQFHSLTVFYFLLFLPFIWIFVFCRVFRPKLYYYNCWWWKIFCHKIFYGYLKVSPPQSCLLHLFLKCSSAEENEKKTKTTNDIIKEINSIAHLKIGTSFIFLSFHFILF